MKSVELICMAQLAMSYRASQRNCARCKRFESGMSVMSEGYERYERKYVEKGCDIIK